MNIMRFFMISLSGVMLNMGCSDDSEQRADQRVDRSPIHDLGKTDSNILPADLRSKETVDAASSYPAPLAYWSMDTTEITGDALKDLAGAHNGTIHGATPDSQGKVGQALALDGQQDYLDFQDVLNGTFAGAGKAFSIAMWINPGAALVNNVLLSKTGDSACDPVEDQRMWSTMLKAGSQPALSYQSLAYGNVHIVGGTTALSSPGTWYHLLFVYDGSVDSAAVDRVTIYVNGVAESLTVTSTGAFPFDLQAGTAHLAFGVRLSASGVPCVQTGAQRFHGSVDELAIWGTPLNPSEAGAVYQRGTAQQKLIP